MADGYRLITGVTAKLPGDYKKQPDTTLPKFVPTPSPEGSIVVVLPIPPRVLSSNGRTRNWNYLAGAVKRYRKQAAELAWYAKRTTEWPMATTPVDGVIRWYGKVNRRADTDNIMSWMKAGIDGLADAGLVENDNLIRWLPAERLKDADNPRVEITFYRRAREEQESCPQ